MAFGLQSMSSAMRSGGAHLRGALFTALLVFVFLSALFPLRSFDIWWHLANGRELFEGRGLPFENRYSFVCPEYKVVPTHWLFGVTAYLVHRLGGESALVFLKALLVTACFSLVYLTCRMRGAGPAISVGVVALAALASRMRFLERPHLITMLGLAGFAHILELYRRGNRKVLWVLPPLAALWANFHAGCLFGVGLVGLAAAGEAPPHRAPAGEPGHASLRGAIELGIVCVACALAVMFSPATWHVYAYNIWHLQVGEAVPLVEFRTALPHEQPIFYLLLVSSAAALIVNWKAVRPSDVLNVTIFGALGVYAIREIPSFAIIVSPFFASALSEAWRHLQRVYALIGRVPSDVFAHSLVALLLGFPPLAHIAGGTGGRFRIGLGVAQGFFPEGASAFVERELPNERVFNDLASGGFLAWKWYPRRRIFIDGRTNAYPRGLLAELYRYRVSTELIDSVTRRHGIDAALLFFYKGENPFWKAFDPAKWAVVFAEESALVLLKRTASNGERIQRFEKALGARGFEVLSRRFAQLGDVHVLRAADAAELALAAEASSGTVEFSPRERAGLFHRKAHGLRMKGSTSEAIRAYRDALALRPDWPEAQANLGFALLEAGRPEEAKGEFIRALSVGRRPTKMLLGLAMALEALGEKDAAAAHYRELVESGEAGDAELEDARQALERLAR